jgi:hypothetical protein
MKAQRHNENKRETSQRVIKASKRRKATEAAASIGNRVAAIKAGEK